MSSNEFWLVTVPNRGDSVETTFGKVQRATAEPPRDLAKPTRIDLPNLVVGTLDSLMALSDDLVKTDFQTESLVKRIERQYRDLESKKGAEELKVAGQPLDRYISNFTWEYAKYPQRRTLPELVALVLAGTSKIEEELKSLSQAYTDKVQTVQSLKRKKGGSLATAALEEVLTEDVLKGFEFLNTEFLLTLVVVVPRQLEQEWNQTYHTIGADIASYNTPDWCSSPRTLGRNDGKFGKALERSRVKGSPVVPGSTKKLFEDSEAALYTVTVLKGQYEAGHYEGEDFQNGVFVDYVEAFKAKARERRFVARNFTFDPAAAEAARGALDKAQVELQQTLAQLTKWCKAHYGEAVTAWMHIKMIRTFVEAVLRYGLPVDYTTIIFRPKAKRERQLQQALEGLYGDVTGPMFGANAKGDADDEKEEFVPFVLNRFNPYLT